MLSRYVSLGQLVEASRGRDEGKLFFIIKIVDDEYVFISDGRSRKLDKPKLKKIKHLNIRDYVNNDLKELLHKNENITDAFIRAELNKLK